MGCQACFGKPALPSTSTAITVPPPTMPVVDTSCYAGLPELASVLTTAVRVMRHVPKGIRIPFCDALRECIQRFAVDSSKQTLVLLFLLPKVVLAATGRGGKRGKRQVAHLCLQRLERWAAGEWVQLWTETLVQRRGPFAPGVRRGNPAHPQEEEARYLQRRILDILADKGISKPRSWFQMVSTSALQQCCKSFGNCIRGQKSRSLWMPTRQHVARGTKSAEHVEASIKAVVQQFPTASGAGPSQLRPAHLKEALFCGSDIAEQSLLRSLQCFITKAASGSLPAEL